MKRLEDAVVISCLLGIAVITMVSAPGDAAATVLALLCMAYWVIT